MLTFFLTAISVTVLLSCLFGCLITGYTPIELFDETFNTDIEGFFDKRACSKNIKKFLSGNINGLFSHIRREGNCLISRYYVSEKITNQEMFNFNLALLRYRFMAEGIDTTPNNMASYILENPYTFETLFLRNHEETNPIWIPEELMKAMLDNKERLTTDLLHRVSYQKFMSKTTPFHYMAQNGNMDAKEFLTYVVSLHL